MIGGDDVATCLGQVLLSFDFQMGTEHFQYVFGKYQGFVIAVVKQEVVHIVLMDSAFQPSDYNFRQPLVPFRAFCRNDLVHINSQGH